LLAPALCVLSFADCDMSQDVRAALPLVDVRLPTITSAPYRSFTPSYRPCFSLPLCAFPFVLYFPWYFPYCRSFNIIRGTVLAVAFSCLASSELVDVDTAIVRPVIF
jgi:hypothetical protein